MKVLIKGDKIELTKIYEKTMQIIISGAAILFFIWLIKILIKAIIGGN